jgi:hypothetical protein
MIPSKKKSSECQNLSGEAELTEDASKLRI